MMNFFKRDIVTTKYIPYPQNYPMGAYTFAIACATCKHYGLGVASKRCQVCRGEINSGYEHAECYFYSAPFSLGKKAFVIENKKIICATVERIVFSKGDNGAEKIGIVLYDGKRQYGEFVDYEFAASKFETVFPTEEKAIEALKIMP